MKNERKSVRRPAHAVVTVPDPERIPTCSHVEYGGTLQFRCETTNYPHFEIQFEATDASGESTTLVYPGSIDHPVVIAVTEDGGPFVREGEYRYKVHHHHKKPKKKGGPYTGPDTGTWSIFVKHCRAC